MPCDELVENLEAFATLVFSSRILPQVFWTLHTSANLSALRQKARPVACGDGLRRVTGAIFCSRYERKLADYFKSRGQLGVVVSGRAGIMAPTPSTTCTPQVSASARGNRPLSCPLRIKLVRTGTPQPPVCIKWGRF